MDRRNDDLLMPFACLLVGAGLAGLFLHAGDTVLESYQLRLGSLDQPTSDYVVFTAFWALLGGPAVLFLAFGLARLAGASQLARLSAAFGPARDSIWIAGAVTLAIAIPACLREGLLGSAPLTDDEGAYEFMARLLASGRVYADSPPLKEHFDIHFMVNNGKYYSHYFLGWPALMVPGVLLGIPKHMGALYSGVLMAGLYLVVRRVAGAKWARLASAVYLTSTLFMIGAATQLSHIPCAAALIWFALSVLRSRDDGAPAWIHAAVAALFVIAFFMRPMTTIGVGLPFLVYWGSGAARLPPKMRLFAGLSFGLVAILGSTAFMAINRAQNGSVLGVAYQAYLAYSRQNGFAFSPFTAAYDRSLSSFHFSIGPMLSGFAGTLYRVNFGAFGWPSCLLPVALAWRAPRTRIWWWSLGFCTLTNVPVEGAGIDTFGPIKATEACVIILVLVTSGLARLETWLKHLQASPDESLRRMSSWFSPRLPAAFGFSVVFMSLIAYVPPEMAVVARIARAVTLAERTLEQNGIERALVFTGRRRVPRCASTPTRHHVLQRPYNSPGFSDPILWVNRLSPDSDAALRAHYGDRPAYYLTWEADCRPAFVPFEAMPSHKGQLEN